VQAAAKAMLLLAVHLCCFLLAMPLAFSAGWEENGSISVCLALGGEGAGEPGRLFMDTA